MTELEILNTVNFEWTQHLRSVWETSEYDVPELHSNLQNNILEKVDQLIATQQIDSPLGKVIVGTPGAGKTHLLGSIRKNVFQKNQWFVLVDMTDVRDFNETVLLGYIDSLQITYSNEKLQHEVVLERFFQKANIENHYLRNPPQDEDNLIEAVSKIIHQILRIFRSEMQRYKDVFRALLYFNAPNPEISEIGYSYLYGLELDILDQRKFKFRNNSEKHTNIIKALSWIMSKGGVTVLALDQLDAIVTQHHLASGGDDEKLLTDEQKTSLSIINGIGGGLSSLRDSTQRTLTIVSCLLQTWQIIERKVLSAATDRYESHSMLKDISHKAIISEMIRLRLNEVYRLKNYHPKYDTWPFKPESFDSLVGLTPRDILKQCDNKRREWIQSGKVFEIADFGRTSDIGITHQPSNKFQELSRIYEDLKSNLDISNLLDEEFEDSNLGLLLQNSYKILLREFPPYDSIDIVIDTEFQPRKSFSSLHARIRIIYHKEMDKEDHYCVRVLLSSKARAYQNRLKAAMTASGIDKNLSFRCLRLIREKDIPTGNVTQKLTKEFTENHGIFIKPSIDDLKAMLAIRKMENDKDIELDEWLASYRPLSALSIMRDTVLWLKERLPEVQAPKLKGHQPKVEPVSPSPVEGKEQNRIVVGKRLFGGKEHETLGLDLSTLTKHTVVLASAGSGKTVLIKRLIEEAAMHGIPSIVIDAANDLARLGDHWPQNPQSWQDDDIKNANEYFRNTETVVWTPARKSGNPLYLSPLPNFTAVRDDPDELELTISLARDALKETLALGSSANVQKKIGVLSAALNYFARNSDSKLDDFIALLADLPIEATGDITNATKFAVEIADQLRAAKMTSPLLKSDGRQLNPSILFGRDQDADKTRISVINFSGLPGLESQHQFLNQLAMTLFTWIKKFPVSVGKPIQGLLVIDEAKDFVPSGKSTPCKESLIRLTAQARKYGLGLIFATQAPKSMDHNIIANCSTHFYGKANSPTAIETIVDQIKQRGGSGQDVSKLDTGTFYVFSDKINGGSVQAPIKMKSSMCLSYHPNGPLDENAVLERAQKSRKHLNINLSGH